MKTPTKNKEEGFTIIEVMIVLAIAALIMVVVLVAIPQLQSNQRNNARQSIAARITTEINNYAGNNNGRFPGDTSDTWQDFQARYLSNEDSFRDPLTNNIIGDQADTRDDLVGENADPGTAAYHLGSVCDGESIEDGRNRNFAFQVALEGGAVYCLDNR